MFDYTINEIFLKIDAISRRSGVVLNYPTKNFFVLLLDYFNNNGLYDDEKSSFYIETSISSLRKEFSLSSHIVQTALSSLNECNLIERIKYKPSFSKKSSGVYSVNKPSRIYINYDLLASEELKDSSS